MGAERTQDCEIPLHGDEDYERPIHGDEGYGIPHHGDEDYDIPIHGDEDYEIACDMEKNISYTITRKALCGKSTIATSVPSTSFSNHAENSKNEDTLIIKKCGTQLICLMALIICIAFIIATVVTSIAFVQISKLRSDVTLIRSTSRSKEKTLYNNVTMLGTSIKALKSIMDVRFSKLNDQLSSSLSFINQVVSKITGNTDYLDALFVDVLNKTGYSFDSCATIRKRAPSSPSGNYYIKSSNDTAVFVYCDMTRVCGNITGGWIRVAELDMTDNITQCPGSLRLLTSPRRTCRAMNSDTPTCSSDKFTLDGVGYSNVCGRVRAYQVGTPEAFGNTNPLANSSRGTSNPNIETYYVDGVSLTHGTSPRQHIWTFAAAVNEDNHNINDNCPCINTTISSSIAPPPSFVGKDYFCDTAALTDIAFIFDPDDPLWDGAGCGPQNTCCTFNNPPWFYKQLPQSTTEDIEMRVCRDQRRSNEDIVIEVIEIYVQ